MGAGGGTGTRPSPNRCPRRHGPRGGRRGVSLPLLAVWPTPGVVRFWRVRLSAFTELPPCGFGVEGRSGWKPWLCPLLSPVRGTYSLRDSVPSRKTGSGHCILPSSGPYVWEGPRTVLGWREIRCQVIGGCFVIVPAPGIQGGINMGWSEADVFPEICI